MTKNANEAKAILWEQKIVKLQNFKSKHGHCRVPLRYSEDTVLASWVYRVRLGRIKITKDQKKKLSQLGFSWKPREDRWKENFLKLKKYKNTHGHLNIPKNDSDSQLIGWIDKQRMNKKQLLPKQKMMLEEIGFIWKKFDSQWENKFQKLKEFKEKYGHLKIGKKSHSELAAWACHQQSKKDTLDLDKKKKLEDIGFDWFPCKDMREDKFQQLMDFKNVHGHCNVPNDSRNRSLRHWVNLLRSSKKKLDPDFVKKLDEVGFIWSMTAKSWEDNFQRLVEFKKINGHCRVPRIFPVDQPLANWSNGLRLKNPGMSKDIRKRLKEIGFYDEIQNNNQKNVA